MEEKKKQIWICIGVIFLVTALLYFPLLSADFIGIDDGTHLFKNPLILHPTASTLWEFWRKPFFELYIPLTYSVWWGVAKLSLWLTDTLDPFFFHFLNLIFHFLNSTGVFLFLVIFVPPLAALVGALLFCLHPIQVESVAWVSCFKDLLSFFLGLCAAGCFWKAVRSEQQLFGAWKRGRTGYGLATLFFFLSLLSKPGMIVLPLLILCVARILPELMTPIARRVCGLWFLGSILWGGWLTILQPGSQFSFYVPIYLRWRIAGDALFHYFKQILIPTGLTLDYARIPQFVLNDPLSLFSWMIPVGFGLGLFIHRNRWNRELTGALFWGVGFLPVLGLVPFAQQTYSTVTDRYAYIPFVGVSLVVASVVDRIALFISGRKKLKILFQWVLFLLLLILASLSRDQIKLWNKTATLASAMIQLNPKSYQGNYALAGALYENGAYEEAIPFYRTALDLHPDSISASFSLGTTFLALKRYDEARAVFQKALDEAREDAIPENRATYSRMRNSLGVALIKLNRPQEAEQEFRKALRLDPGYDQAMRNLQRLGVSIHE